MCDFESSRLLWHVAGGEAGFVLCVAHDQSGYLLWRVLRQGRDGVVIVDRTYYTGHDLIRDWFHDLVDGVPEVITAFRSAVERYPGLRNVWREYVRQFLRANSVVSGSETDPEPVRKLQLS